MTFDSWTMLGARTVGVVFVAAALMKLAAPFSFYRHVARLDVLPHLPLRIFVPVAIGLEGGWGAALAVGLWPQLLLPFTTFALVALTCVTWWSIKSGKTEDCGCYGGFITPSVWQSVALNGFYFLLIVAAWATLPAANADAIWKIAAVTVTAVLLGGTAEYALRSEFSTGVPLFTPSPLKIGQRWKPGWAGTASHKLEPSHLVAYLGPDCPYCKRWVRALNVIHESPALPPVTAILSSSQRAIDDFVLETGVRFPIATISQAKMQRLSSAVPTTVLIEDGRIQDVWRGAAFSESFTSRFKAVFFPSTVQSPGAAQEARVTLSRS
jgi:hypothetical protein